MCTRPRPRHYVTCGVLATLAAGLAAERLYRINTRHGIDLTFILAVASMVGVAICVWYPCRLRDCRRRADLAEKERELAATEDEVWWGVDSEATVDLGQAGNVVPLRRRRGWKSARKSS